MKRLFLIYLLPGLVFQSIIIAGGYGTGQELLFFFLSLGPKEGLYSMTMVAIPIISIAAVITFEFARIFNAYDYRTFFQNLLGRFWFVWELGYLFSLTLFFGLMGSAAGEIFNKTFGLPYVAGTLFLMCSIAFLVFWGTVLVERVLSVWSFVLYATYLVFFIWAFSLFGDNISRALSATPREMNWVGNGVKYAALQLSLMPAVLFALRHAESRKHSIVAGLLVGPIAIIPAILFYLVILTHYPDIVDVVLPSNTLLESLDARWFQVLFQLVLLGTLIETGTGVIHAFNERLASLYRSRNRTMPRRVRPVSALTLMCVATLLSKIGLVGIIALAAEVFGMFFLLVFVLPLLFVGIPKIYRFTKHQAEQA